MRHKDFKKNLLFPFMHAMGREKPGEPTGVIPFIC